jgi:hypothetical protein
LPTTATIIMEGRRFCSMGRGSLPASPASGSCKRGVTQGCPSRGCVGLMKRLPMRPHVTYNRRSDLWNSFTCWILNAASCGKKPFFFQCVCTLFGSSSSSSSK